MRVSQKTTASAHRYFALFPHRVEVLYTLRRGLDLPSWCDQTRVFGNKEGASARSIAKNGVSPGEFGSELGHRRGSSSGLRLTGTQLPGSGVDGRRARREEARRIGSQVLGRQVCC